MMKYICSFVFFTMAAGQAFAFEWVNKKTSYLENRYLTMSLGLGSAQLVHDSNIGSDNGFSMHVGLGHQINQYLQAELFYQYSFFDLSSPDPLNPTTNFDTEADMHETGLRMLLFYPAVALKPYLGAGVGGYGLDNARETGLKFDFELQVPLSAGFQAYLYKDLISLDVDFTYRYLFGQSQPAGVLSLLGINDVEFNSYSWTVGVQFHLF